ncbi:MAG: hypothetical protein IK058_01670 [Bacteroidales bacterium]|nr:hypothetical protein [Bacteroidales bacterium]MBR4738692.1 hypothetical protein [Bacteroidales bacterium]
MEKIDFSKTFDEASLKELCEKHYHEMAYGEKYDWGLNLRYICDNSFRLKPFGQFLFWCDELYVFDHHERYREEHNAQAAEDIFGFDFEELGNVHRVIYAGVATPFVTDEGYGIFTGDVVTTDYNPDLIYAVGIANGEYALLSGEEALPMTERHGFNVVGSVFYNLSWCDDYTLNERIAMFVEELQRNGDSGEIRAKIKKTPFFAQQ